MPSGWPGGRGRIRLRNPRAVRASRRLRCHFDGVSSRACGCCVTFMDEGVRVSDPAPTMAAIHEGLQLYLSGDRAAARARFSDLWNEIGENGDPLHRCAVAHYMADVRDDPAEELEWDLLALRAADSLTDDRATPYHASLAEQRFY